jgi:hypothetical protein
MAEERKRSRKASAASAGGKSERAGKPAGEEEVEVEESTGARKESAEVKLAGGVIRITIELELPGEAMEIFRRPI